MKSCIRKLCVFAIVALFFSTVLPNSSFAESYSDSIQYVSTEIIPPQYKDARNFSERLAAVKKDGKWGYINPVGDTVIDFQYDRAYSFSEGKALVEKHVKEDGELMRYYYIITKDNKTTPLKYAGEVFDNPESYFKNGPLEEIHDTTFYDGYIVVPANSPGGRFVFDEFGEAFDNSAFLPTEGTLVKYNHYADMTAADDDYVALYEELGFVNARPFNQGMAPVYFEGSEKNKGYWTFLKKDGTLWSGPKFYNFYVNDIHQSYQIFNEHALASLQNADGTWGAVNKEGKIVLPFQYENLGIFEEGVAAFSKNAKFGFLDIEGNEVIKPQFDEVTPFVNGVAIVRQGKTGFAIDKKGNKIKGSDNLSISSYFQYDASDDSSSLTAGIKPQEFIITKKNNKYGFNKIEDNRDIVSVSGINLNKTSLEIEAGNTELLKATVSPADATDNQVTWSSSNEAVATVDSKGMITAKSKGEALITVTSKDGGYEAMSKVTVVDAGPYKDYKPWNAALENRSANHSWRIQLNMLADKNTVDDQSIFIVDKNHKKVNFINPKVENSKNKSTIVLNNTGSFVQGENYWIIIKDSVTSDGGKKLKSNLKARFKITK